MTLVTTSRDALADALGAMPEAYNVADYTDEQTTHLPALSVEVIADALLASGAVIDAANDDEFRRRLRQACNDPGSFVARNTRSTNGREPLTKWQDRALVAALSERGERP